MKVKQFKTHVSLWMALITLALPVVSVAITSTHQLSSALPIGFYFVIQFHV